MSEVAISRLNEDCGVGQTVGENLSIDVAQLDTWKNWQKLTTVAMQGAVVKEEDSGPKVCGFESPLRRPFFMHYSLGPKHGNLKLDRKN